MLRFGSALLAPTLMLFSLAATASSRTSLPEVHFEKDNFALDLSAFDKVKQIAEAGSGQMQGRWTAEYEGRKLDISVLFLSRGELGLDHPNEALDLIEGHYQRSQTSQKNGIFAFQEKQFIGGEYGALSFAGLGTHTELEGTKPVMNRLVFTGILIDSAWVVEMDARPALLDEQREAMTEILSKAVSYSGESIDPEWSQEEIEERWRKEAPEDLAEDLSTLNAVRTEHYIVLTNQKGNTPKKFAEVMEECYENIRTIFPFEDIPGQRLLPLYLFRTPDQYYQFLIRNLGYTMEKARRTGGIAYQDLYATYFKSKNDPVHIHEATHQIFRNRLFLGGGGSWFQEGAAEYVCNEPNQVTVVRNKIKKGRAMTLRKMVGQRSLLFSAEDRVDGTSAGSEAYMQAGILFEFLRQDKKHQDRFLDFVHAMGSVARNDLPAIEWVLSQTLGLTLEELDEELKDYCNGRPKKMDRFKPIKLKKKKKR